MQEMTVHVDIETIRKRPGLYVGTTNQTGVYNLIFMLVDGFIHVSNKNSVFIGITLNDDNSLVFTCNRPIVVDNDMSLAIVRALSDIFELNNSNERPHTKEIKFRPCNDLFTYERIEYYKLFNRLKELVQLNGHLIFQLMDSTNKT